MAILIKKNQNKYLSAIRTAASCLFLMIFVVVVVWVFCLFFGFSFVFFCLFVCSLFCSVLFFKEKRQEEERKRETLHLTVNMPCPRLVLNGRMSRYIALCHVPG